MLAPKCLTYNGRPTFANPMYLRKAQSEKPYLYKIPYDTSDLANRFGPNREKTMTLKMRSLSDLNASMLNYNACIFIKFNKNVNEFNNLRSKSSGVNHTTSVSRPQLKCYQVKDKVMPNNSQVKFKKKEVEDHHRISSISKKTKFVIVCNDNSNPDFGNGKCYCAECGKYVFNSNHDACVSRYLNDVNARTKKPKVVPISASKPKRKENKSVALPI
ncbi:hypothetical protein Tco_1409977 [Tanacetum coccineum]